MIEESIRDSEFKTSYGVLNATVCGDSAATKVSFEFRREESSWKMG